MITLYNSLPWPIFLTISFGAALVTFVYFFKNSSKYPNGVVISFSLFGLSFLVTGLGKIVKVLDVFTEFFSYIMLLSMILMLLAAIILIVNWYKLNSDNPVGKRIVIQTIVVITSGLFLLGLTIAFKLLS